MKKFSTLLPKAFLVLVAWAGSAFAYQEFDSSDSCCSDNSLFVGVDFLWWKPNIDNLDFAAVREATVVDQVPTLSAHYHNVNPSWEPGVRGIVGLDNLYQGWNLTASYTYIGIDHVNQLVAQPPAALVSPLLNAFLIAPVLPQGAYRSVHSKYISHYNNWDILVSHDISCTPCFDVHGFFGFTALYMDQYWRLNYAVPAGDPIPTVGNTAQIIWQSDFWGAGIKIGSTFAYDFTRCFSAFGTVSASILTGRDDNTIEGRVFTPSAGLNTRILKAEDDTDHWQFVPGYHIQAGLRYETCYCGTAIGLRLGYEFVNWYNLPNPRIGLSSIPSERAISTSPNTSQYGFHGVFVGGDILF